MDISQIVSFNMVIVDKEYQWDVLFFQSLLWVIINSSSAVILEDSHDLDRELSKLVDNIHRGFFFFVKGK